MIEAWLRSCGLSVAAQVWCLEGGGRGWKGVEGGGRGWKGVGWGGWVGGRGGGLAFLCVAVVVSAIIFSIELTAITGTIRYAAMMPRRASYLHYRAKTAPISSQVAPSQSVQRQRLLHPRAQRNSALERVFNYYYYFGLQPLTLPFLQAADTVATRNFSGYGNSKHPSFSSAESSKLNRQRALYRDRAPTLRAAHLPGGGALL